MAKRNVSPTPVVLTLESDIAICQKPFVDGQIKSESYSKDAFVSQLDELIDEHSLFLPLHDIALHQLSKTSEACEKSRDVCGSAQLIKIAQDKLATHEFVISFDMPFCETLDEPLRNRENVVKSRFGWHPKYFTTQSNTSDKPVVYQARLSGTEFTAYCFFNFGDPIVVPHSRDVLFGSGVTTAKTFDHDEIRKCGRQLANIFHDRYGFLGPFCIQGFVNGREFELFEINLRLGGGYPLTFEAGGDFITPLLAYRSERTTRPAKTSIRWGLQMDRFFTSTFTQGGEQYLGDLTLSTP